MPVPDAAVPRHVANPRQLRRSSVLPVSIILRHTITPCLSLATLALFPLKLCLTHRIFFVAGDPFPRLLGPHGQLANVAVRFVRTGFPADHFEYSGEVGEGCKE